MPYDHTVNMSHFGWSGTVLDTPNTLVSILNLTMLNLHGLKVGIAGLTRQINVSINIQDVLQAQLEQPWSGSDKSRIKYSYGT